MMPPYNCPYKGLTAPPCWKCIHYLPDTAECHLNYATAVTVNNTGKNIDALVAPTYEERLRKYEKRRQELLQLSKEALVDLIIHKPTNY